MIRIAYVIDTIESPTAGTEKQLLLLLEHMDRQQFSPLLCVLRSSPWLERNFDLCPVYKVEIDSFKTFSSWKRIGAFAGFLKRENIELVHVFFRDSSLAGILAARLAGMRAIIASRRNQGYWMNTGERILQRSLNRWVDLIIANCRNTADMVVRNEKFPEEKVRVVYNGLELKKFQSVSGSSMRHLRSQLGIPESAAVVGTVANLRPIKGLDIFIKAAGIVARAEGSVHFVIAGEGPERKRLEALALESGLAGRVHFLGSRQDIPELLSMFNVGVLPSHSESFSNALIEYLAARLPVVCTDVGGCREAVEQGVNGFIVPPGDFSGMADRVLEILSGAFHFQDTLADDQFALSEMVAGYQDIYSNLLTDVRTNHLIQESKLPSSR